MNDFQTEIKNVVRNLVNRSKKGEGCPSCSALIDNKFGFDVFLDTRPEFFGDIFFVLSYNNKILEGPHKLVLIEKEKFGTNKYYSSFSHILADMLDNLIMKHNLLLGENETTCNSEQVM